MGSIFEQPDGDALFLPFDAADGDDAFGELVLVDLVSSEDAVLAYALDSDGSGGCVDDESVAAGTAAAAASSAPSSPEYVTQQQQQQQQHEVAVAGALPPASTRLLSRKQRGGKKPSLKANPNKARDERKGELIYLRKKVAELETQLAGLQAKRPRITTAPVEIVGAATDDSGTPATGVCAECRDVQTWDSGSGGAQQQATPPCPHARLPMRVFNVWQDIASRQSEERVKAERENIRLKLVLENQLKVARSLEKILHKKATTKDMEEFVERSQMCAPTADASDSEVFRQLLAGVEQSYLDVDAVFEANGLAHTETPVSNARVRSDALSGMFLEIFANQILPFDMHATASAVWHHFTFAKEKTPFRCYSYASSSFLHASEEDTIVENFIMKLDAKGTVGNFRVKQILRRHVEAERVVVVWRASIEAFEFSAEPVSGIRFCECGYIVIKRPTTGTHTLLQTCYIFTPDFTDELASSDHPRVGAITDFVLTSTAANISSTHQMIENVLLEQSLKSSSGGCVEPVG